MENLLHYRQQNRGSASLSKKIFSGNNNGGPLASKSMYDDVFGGPPKFGVSALSPRFEDYSEIFGSFNSSRNSSIPVLDLPDVDETEVFFDVRGSSLDYSEVFGGFDGLDFAVSFEDLIDQSKVGNDNSSDEAWTPEGTESLSDDSDHPGNIQCMSNGHSQQSLGKGVEFSIFYNKYNHGSNGDMSKETTYVTQPTVVPGSKNMVDEAISLQTSRDFIHSIQMTDDDYGSMDSCMGMIQEKHWKNNMSHRLDSGVGGQASESAPQSQKGYSRNAIYHNETFVTVSEISLRTKPSQVPPPSRPPPAKVGDHTRLTSNYTAAVSEGTRGDGSPPFFDVEVDASSSAAASAAAMKEVIEKAQEKLRTAKEHMDRKKELYLSHLKPGLKNDVIDEEPDWGRNLNEANHQRYEKVKHDFEVDNHEMKLPARKARRKGMKTTEPPPVSVEHGDPLRFSEVSTEDELSNKSISGQPTERLDSTNEWKEATEFFELVQTDEFLKPFEQGKNGIIVEEHGKVEKGTSTRGFEQHEDVNKDVKTFPNGLQEPIPKIEEVVVLEEDIVKLKPYRDPSLEIDRKMSKEGPSVSEVGEYEKKPGIKESSSESRKPKSRDDKSDRQRAAAGVKKREHRSVTKLAAVTNDHGLKQEEVKKVKGKKCMQNEQQRIEGVERKQKFPLEQKRSPEQAVERSESDQRLEKLPERMRSRKIPEESLEQEHSLRKQPEAIEMESLGEQDDALEREDHDERGKEAHEEEKKGHRPEADKTSSSKDSLDGEAYDMKFEESFFQLDIEDMIKDADEYVETNELFKDTYESKELGGISKVQSVTGSNDDGKKVKSSARTQMANLTMSSGGYLKNDNEEAASRASERELEDTGVGNIQVDEGLNASGSCQVELGHMSGNIKIKSGSDRLASPEPVKKTDAVIGSAPIKNEEEVEHVEILNVLVNENKEASGMLHEENELELNKLNLKDVKVLFCSAETEKKSGEPDYCDAQNSSKSRNIASKMDSHPENTKKKVADEPEDQGKGLHRVEKDQEVSNQAVKESIRKGEDLEVTQNVSSGEKQAGQKIDNGVTSQETERKEKNVSETLTNRVNEGHRIRTDHELEDDLRKLEEEREREREREKDRMPVDRFEMRERKFTEAREKTERAAMERMTSEARQRAMTEARERLEKACAEAKEKTLAGKVAMEGRINAERAAVERATAEARQRAFEKARAERAAFEARERVDRPISDKFSALHRNGGTRPTPLSSDLPDVQCRTMGSSSDARSAYSSVHTVTEKNDGGEIESAQRCKARLERYRRTAERAAKALAEKNMRDLLALREQAERNRLADTLDADVRRWSSGKEGNLRALLSTLQYILGPDSGWQPIPLTEVITAAAVKKAYRKATLCVHPDKLQQRGASIQQKYICEKVFDLLKEAWNKFNSEER